MKKIFTLFFSFAIAQIAISQSPITQWNFNASITAPSFGTGTVAGIGGVASSSATGNGSSDPTQPGQALQTTTYPAAAVGNKTAGIEVAVSTLGFTGIRLSFDIRFSNTAANLYTVQYSTDGVAFTDFTTATFTANGNNFQNNQLFDFSAIPALNNNLNAKFRFVSTFNPAAYVGVASTYASAGTVRFDLVTISGTPSVVAFSSAGDISAVKSSNKTNLTWTLGCTAARCTYELQRSANSVTFTTINSATVTPAQCAAPFNFTDAQPLSGINYYRVKVIDLDGAVSYSKIAAVRFNGSEPIKVVPTIAVNDVKVFYESATTGTSSWIVYDMTGRAVSNSNVNLVKGQNTITINVANLMKGQYQIVGNTEAGKTDAVKIIKQ